MRDVLIIPALCKTGGAGRGGVGNGGGGGGGEIYL